MVEKEEVLAISPISITFHGQDEFVHLMVLYEAFRLFVDRSKMRGDMWRQFPPADKIRELRERVSRIETCLTTLHTLHLDETRDAYKNAMREDAIDIINYATFFIKQIDEGAEL